MWPPTATIFKDLEWMIGEWKADGIRSGLQIKSEWLAGRNFIKNTYTTTTDGKAMLTGTRSSVGIPGWDELSRWHFDAEGGFGNDV